MTDMPTWPDVYEVKHDGVTFEIVGPGYRSGPFGLEGDATERADKLNAAFNTGRSEAFMAGVAQERAKQDQWWENFLNDPDRDEI